MMTFAVWVDDGGVVVVWRGGQLFPALGRGLGGFRWLSNKVRILDERGTFNSSKKVINPRDSMQNGTSTFH